jgi:hypothetical protein
MVEIIQQIKKTQTQIKGHPHPWCHNPSLGLTTKAKACKGMGQEWSRRVTFHDLESVGMWENVKEWTFALPSELPLWELESRWTLEFSKSDCKGQNPLN